jgi:hypothetical protein
MATVDTASDGLPAGWPDVIRTRVWIGREDDYWYALDADFDIVAQGDSPEAAERQLVEMVQDYLNSCVRDGLPYDQARRPVPRATCLRLDAEFALTRLLRGRFPKPVKRDRVELPPRLAAGAC